MKHETTPPIILIHSDHGPRINLYKDTMSTFVAMYNPYKKTSYPEIISNVNLYRLILNSLISDYLPTLDNTIYFSTYAAPYQYNDITKKSSFDKTLRNDIKHCDFLNYVIISNLLFYKII